MAATAVKHVWSPWRMAYIEGHASESGCLFCSCLAAPDGPGNLILHRTPRACVILNRYPYTNGHAMVVPVAHQPTLETLDETTQLDLLRLTSRVLLVLRRTYGAEAFNLGANIGRAAGAGIEGHFHLHVLPRWAGDTNFMATTAETRVIPESLDTTYGRMHAAWQELESPS
jgi:ATP adenylyltransferase